MSKTQFKELLEEYISNLEKDYDSNQTGNSNHPTYSLIKNTYKKIEDKYFYRKLGCTLTYFLFCLVYIAITIALPSLPCKFQFNYIPPFQLNNISLDKDKKILVVCC
jgi:hypothetical protein